LNPVVEFLFLFVAGVTGGMLNSIAGGGSFITFPALLLVGVPPVAANATNTFSSCSGYLSGAYALRHELLEKRLPVGRYVGFSLVGGALGAWLLLQTPEARFREAVPWLLLFASVLFIWGGRLNLLLRGLSGRYQHASTLGGLALALFLLAVCTYGGFFNAGLGIIILSYLVLAGETDINAMNGVKLLVSSAVSLIAIILFVVDGVIAWREGLIVLVGTLIGGYLAAHYSRRLPQHAVRGVVIAASVVITGWFFYDIYWVGDI
jgi:hypothetical protein